MVMMVGVDFQIIIVKTGFFNNRLPGGQNPFF